MVVALSLIPGLEMGLQKLGDRLPGPRPITWDFRCQQASEPMQHHVVYPSCATVERNTCDNDSIIQ